MGFVGLFKLALKCFDTLAWPVFALGYPLCASIQAIETNSNADIRKLITYWVSFSLILLFEHAFEQLLEWLPVWAYIKLMIVCCLVMPHFDGSLHAYKHLVHPCLSVDRQIVVNQLNKLKEVFFKKDNILVEVVRHEKENGPEALENLVASKSKSVGSDLVVKEIKAEAEVNVPKFEQPKPTHKDIHAVERTDEKEEVASSKQFQVTKVEPTVAPAENRTCATLVTEKVASAEVAGRDHADMPPSKQVQKEWTCAICQVTTTSAANLHSHLNGRRHEAACEQLKAKNKPPKSNVSFASVGKKSNVTKATAVPACSNFPNMPPSTSIQKPWTCAICQVTTTSKADLHSHLQGRQHKFAFEQLTAKNQTSGSKVSPAPVEKKPHVPTKEPGKWWCTICNVSCTSMITMNSHLNGSRHLARTRELNGLGGNGHA